MIIGLDGATFDLIDPWVDRGELPTLAGMIRGGTRGHLRSVLPSLSAPAWVSFMTGKNPGKHGIFCFERELPTPFSPGQRGIVDARAIESETLWQVLSRAGRSVGVMNVPITYPPAKVNGFLISCFLTPPGAPQFTYPPSLRNEIPDYKICIDYNTRYFFEDRGVDYRQGERDVFEEQLDVSSRRAEAAVQLLRSRSPDFFVVVFKGTDDMQHFFWHEPDRLLRYYKLLDGKIADLLQAAGPDANVMVVSDHGFGPSARREFNITTFLIEGGWLRRKRTAGAALNASLLKAARRVKRAVLGARSTAWTKRIASSLTTTAENSFDFSGLCAYGETRGLPGVYLVRDGRRLDPQRPLDEWVLRLRSQIVAALREVVDPETGGKVFTRVENREDVYDGPYVGRAPEIVLQPSVDHAVAPMLGAPLLEDRESVNSGSHGSHPLGVFIAKGPDVKAGRTIDEACLIDIMPTVLHMLGVPVPQDVDGKVLTGMFREDSELGRRAVAYQAAHPVARGAGDAAYSVEDKEVVEQRLRALGYID